MTTTNPDCPYGLPHVGEAKVVEVAKAVVKRWAQFKDSQRDGHCHFLFRELNELEKVLEDVQGQRN